MVRFLFNYGIRWHLRQDLCVFGTKNWFVMKNLQNSGLEGVG